MIAFAPNPDCLSRPDDLKLLLTITLTSASIRSAKTTPASQRKRRQHFEAWYSSQPAQVISIIAPFGPKKEKEERKSANVHIKGGVCTPVPSNTSPTPFRCPPFP